MTKSKVFLIGLTYFYSVILQAADLRGQLTGLSGASVVAICGDIRKSTSTSNKGGFYITNLPVNHSCHFTVTHGSASSVRTSFNTKASVTEFRGSLRKVGKKIIVVRK